MPLALWADVSKVNRPIPANVTCRILTSNRKRNRTNSGSSFWSTFTTTWFVLWWHWRMPQPGQVNQPTLSNELLIASSAALNW